MASYFLGLDYSTQKLKAIVVDDNGGFIVEDSIDYDIDLKHYGTSNGVYKIDNEEIYAPSIMWIEATDLLFTRLESKIDLSKIISICGSAQQHTSMFWGKNANVALSTLDPSLTLAEQLKDIFSKPLSPTWMDSSTKKECSAIENFFGGKNAFQSRIGSSLANRFTGPQILKAFRENENLDNLTEHITLVSNGICSIFVGKIVGMDISDAAGTGLQKSGSLYWDCEICSFISKNLESKLGIITDSSGAVMGNLNNYFAKRYNMIPDCKIISFTGDNPSSVVGMLLNKNDLCLSLGTSDTLFACLSQLPNIVPDIPVFVFPHPLASDVFVTLLCYKNGSSIRDVICNQFCNGDWETFGHLLDTSSPGNNGIFGLFYDLPEITPSVKGRFFQNYKIHETRILEHELSSASLIRGLIEGQFLAKICQFSKISSEKLEFFDRLLITGGASVNKSILQVAANIFNKMVITIDTADSAAMGAIYRSVAAIKDELFLTKFSKSLYNWQKVCNPQDNIIYQGILPSFSTFLESISSNAK